MKLDKFSLAVMAGLILVSLAGCKEGQQAELIAKVQQAARVTCGFVPIASTVAAVLDGMSVTGGSATVAVVAAKSICVMVTADRKQTFLGWGEANGVKPDGCWAIDPKCKDDGTLSD